MEDLRFAIVDDDISIRRILQRIIADEELGTVVAECGDGLEAAEILLDCQAQIALVDMLLPGQDGVALIKRLTAAGLPSAFIMISQVNNASMIAKAYESGIEFFIHKPINVIEVVSVIKKVKESIKLRQFMSMISQTASQYSAPVQQAKSQGKGSRKTAIYGIFSDLGIIGEAGTKDIYLMIEQIDANSDNAYQLSDLYGKLSQNQPQEAKAAEQRVRRAITKALQNLANLGIEDYYNDHYQTYSSLLFDVQEIRKEMNFINGKSKYHGKINVKKFIEGIIFTVEKSF